MKFAFFVFELGNGGQERQLYYILSNLNENPENDVTLFVWTYDENQKYAQLIKGFNVNVVKLNESTSYFERIKRIRKILKEKNPPILQSFSFPLNLITFIATINLPILPVGALRSSFSYQFKSKRGLKNLSVFFNGVFPSFVVSNNLKGRTELLNFRKKILFSRGQVYYLGNKLTLPEIEGPKKLDNSQKYRFVSMGSLLPVKRWDLLIEILAFLKQNGIHFEHYMAGANGPMREELENLIHQKGLQDCVFMTGEIFDLKEFYHSANLLFHTSSSEGTPNVVLEALSHGVPVISSDCGDVRLFVKDSQTGFVIGSDNVQDWLTCVESCLLDKEVYQGLSAGAIRLSEEILSDSKLASEFAHLQKCIMEKNDSETLLKSNVVQSKFNQTQLYLNKNSSIGARIFLVKEILGKQHFGNVLDLGCGDGSIGLSLLHIADKLKLVDISPNMIEKSKENTPENLTGKQVSYLVYDGTKYRSDELFDLIICLGVIAHVDSMSSLFDTLSANLKPGGKLLFQFTEKNSVHGWILYKFFGKGFGAYEVNRTTASVIIPEMKKRGCEVLDNKIYSEATFGLSKFGTQVGVKFKILTSRMVFLKFFFSERLVLFQKK